MRADLSGLWGDIRPPRVSRRTGLRLAAATMAMGAAAFSAFPSFAETAPSGDLLVAAAADLKFALDEVIEALITSHQADQLADLEGTSS